MNKSQGLFGAVGRYGRVWKLNVSGSVTGKYYVGGIVGTNYGVVWYGKSDAAVSGLNYVGGIAGDNCSSINNSISTGKVSGAQYVGGIVGGSWRYCDVYNCYSSSEVKGTTPTENPDRVWVDQRSIGGIAGRNAGTVECCTFDGSATGIGTVGGIVGNNRASAQSYTNESDPMVLYCVSNAKVSGTEPSVGAIVGRNSSRTINEVVYIPHVLNCGWNSTKTPTGVGRATNDSDAGHQQNNSAFTDVSTVKPATVLFKFEDTVIDIPIKSGKQITLKTYPAAAKTDGVKFNWECVTWVPNGNPDYISCDVAEIASGQGTKSALVKPTSKAKLNDEFEIQVNVGNTYGGGYVFTELDDCTITGETAPIDPPIKPDDPKVEKIKPVVVTSKDTLPEEVKDMVEVVSGEVVASAGKVTESVNNNPELKKEIDTTVDMTPLPVFNGEVSEEGATVLVSFNVKLTNFSSKQFKQLALLKVLANGALDQFVFQKTPTAIKAGQFAITGTNGSIVSETAKPTADVEYTISIAIEDGSSFDIDGKKNGSVLDPAVIAAKADTAEPNGGSSGGCSAGFGVFALLLAAVAPVIYRRKR